MEKKTNEFYSSPQMEEIEVKVQGAILAASYSSRTDAYERDTWD